MQAYRYHNGDGEMRITFSDGWWYLTIDGERTGTYTSAEEAAYDVAARNTGNLFWDDMENANAPEDLSGWELMEAMEMTY